MGVGGAALVEIPGGQGGKRGFWGGGVRDSRPKWPGGGSPSSRDFIFSVVVCIVLSVHGLSQLCVSSLVPQGEIVVPKVCVCVCLRCFEVIRLHFPIERGKKQYAEVLPVWSNVSPP